MTAAWESIGYQDGSRGYDAGRIANHSEAFAIKPGRALYDEGRARGLEIFCTGRNGVRMGRQGASYNGVCPRSLEPTFLQGYDFGRSMHDIDAHMNELRNEIQRPGRPAPQRSPLERTRPGLPPLSLARPGTRIRPIRS
jgi:hypothetical protein